MGPKKKAVFGVCLRFTYFAETENFVVESIVDKSKS